MWTIHEDPSGIAFDVLVTPRASREGLGPIHGDRLKIAVTAPPVDGEANAAVVAVLARALAVPKANVTIVRGDGSRRKTVHVRGVGRAHLTALVTP